MKYDLFGYQDEAVEAGLKVLRAPKKCYEVLVAPPAAGKSLIIAAILKGLPDDGNVLVIQPSKELTEQNIEKAESFGMKASVYSASLGKKEFGRIMFATPLSLRSDDFRDKNIKYAIIDECDANTKPKTTLPLFLRNIGVKNCLGLTATPFYLWTVDGMSQLKMINKVWGKCFQNICYVIQPRDLIKMGRWSEIKYCDYQYDSTKLVLNSSGSDFTNTSILQAYVETKQEDKILNLVNSLPKDESILIFLPGIENVEALTRYIKGSVCVTNNTKKTERDKLVKGFKSGEHRIMINAGIFAVGFDYPDLRHIIDAFPTNSARIYIQRIGRIVRVSKETGKKFATYHCISGNFRKFGRIEDITCDFIEKFGWGMFSGEVLLTGVPMGEKLNMTKSKIIEMYKGSVNLSEGKYDFEFDFNTLTDDDRNYKITFGKYEGRTIKWIYDEDKRYLTWILNNFNFNGDKFKKLQQILLKIFKV